MTSLSTTEGVHETPSHLFRWQLVGKKRRLIGAPNKPMKEAQEFFLAQLKPLAPRFHSSTAKEYGLGAVRNARAHHGNRFIFTLDFADAFDHVDGDRLAEMITRAYNKRYPWDAQPERNKEYVWKQSLWRQVLFRFCLTEKGGLIQGSTLSPFLFDWYCEELVDRPIRHYLYEAARVYYGYQPYVYTRFVDNLVISGNERIYRSTRAAIRRIIAKAGFAENFGKTVFIDPFKKKGRTAMVTGIRVSETHFGLPRKKVKETERMIVRALETPLFGEKPSVIKGHALYLLDVLRGKPKLNALEARALRQYVAWCDKNNENSSWAKKTLEKKAPPTLPKKKRSKKP